MNKETNLLQKEIDILTNPEGKDFARRMCGATCRSPINMAVSNAKDGMPRLTAGYLAITDDLPDGEKARILKVAIARRLPILERRLNGPDSGYAQREIVGLKEISDRISRIKFPRVKKSSRVTLI